MAGNPGAPGRFSLSTSVRTCSPGSRTLLPGDRELQLAHDLAQLLQRLAQGNRRSVDQEADFSGIGGIEHCGQQREDCDLFLLSCGQYRSGTAKDGPADAESERVNPLGAGDVQD